MSEMTPSRSYLVKALFDWILDNDMTPHLVVASDVPGTDVPVAYVKDGQITLNISPSAVRDLYMDADAVSFNARFGGVPTQVYVPTAAMLAIFARENGQGMGFGAEPGAELLQAQIEAALQSANLADASDEPAGGDLKESAPKAVTSGRAKATDSTKSKKPQKPGLRIVK